MMKTFSFNFSSPDVGWEKINKELAEQRWDELESGNDVDGYSIMLQNVIEAFCYCAKKVDRKRNIIPRDRRKLMKKRHIPLGIWCPLWTKF